MEILKCLISFQKLKFREFVETQHIFCYVLQLLVVVCHSTCTQRVWWPVLCHCRAAGLELFAGWTATFLSSTV